MGEYVVKLPDVGEGIAEAEIVEWHVAEGDTIAEDQVMVEVMTDKATVELPSPVSGVVASLGGAVGQVLPVGSPLIRITTDGDGAVAPAAPAVAEPSPAPQAAEPDAAPPTTPATTPATAPAAAPPPPPPPPPAPQPNARERTNARGSRPTAAPAVRQRAAALGIDLADLDGSGPDGRVVHADLDGYLTHERGTAAPRRTPASANGDGFDDAIDDIAIQGLRRNIAQRMELSKSRIPHFTYVDEVDVGEIERLRAQLNEEHADIRQRLTILPFLMRAMVVAIRDFPQMNARFDDDNGVVHRHHAVHLGVATQTPKGLMVPVVKHAEELDLWQYAEEIARLSAAARNHKITIEELTGSTITITSLGALGGIVSTPVINYPEVAIVGVNKIATRPVYVDGALLPRQIMNLSSSFDHRVVDGADAAAFVQRIKAVLESPALLFMS